MTNLFVLIGVVLMAVMALFYITSEFTESHQDYDFLFEEEEDDF